MDGISFWSTDPAADPLVRSQAFARRQAGAMHSSAPSVAARKCAGTRRRLCRRSTPVPCSIKLNQKRYQREKPRSFNDFRAFCAQFLKSEKKISKRVLTKSVDLYLYPRHFELLFRSFFGKAARFCSRQNVEFRPAFLLVLPNTHSKHRYQRVSQLCDVSDVKTAGKPPPAPGRNHSVLAMLGREKAKHPLPAQRVVVYLLALSRASVFNVTLIMSLWASRVSRQSGERNVSAF